jgi:hypothetical protein
MRKILPSLLPLWSDKMPNWRNCWALFSQRIASQYGERSVYIWGKPERVKPICCTPSQIHPHSRYIPANAPEEAFDFSMKSVCIWSMTATSCD